MNSKQAGRFYEVKSGSETENAIFPGENPLEFELLRTSLSEEWMPDGPLEEDKVLTIAKGIWRKRRHQRFLQARYTAASFDPDCQTYDEELALRAFYHLLKETEDPDEIQDRLAFECHTDKVALFPGHAALADGMEIIERHFEVKGMGAEPLQPQPGAGIGDIAHVAAEHAALRAEEQQRRFRYLGPPDRSALHQGSFRYSTNFL